MVSSVASAAPSSQTNSNILYVKQTVSGLADCSSWENACGLQTALDKALSGHQIWVAAGTYFPTKLTISTEPRSATFALKTGVKIYGGFPAEGGTWDEHDSATNLTKLSGDIGNPGNKTDNSFHVITYQEVGASAILDGFTISDGNAIYNHDPITGIPSDGNGGGIFISNSSPTLTNLVVSNNFADSMGGGVFNQSSSPTLSNVTFTANSASAGGGMANFSYSLPRLTNVIFNSNTSLVYGGGMYSTNNCNPVLTNVTFSSNHSDRQGGGMLNESSNTILINVTFYANTADDQGGAIANYRSNPTITNSILWGNNPAQIYNRESTATITYSDVEGGDPGTGNINLDPQVSPLSDNGGFTQTHALGAGSPAIDAANPSTCPPTDQRGHLRLIDGNGDFSEICDMGAYEFGYTLNVDIEGNGSVVISPDKPDYYIGEAVTLTANPAPDWAFTGWSGSVSGTENPLVVTIDGDKTITARFEQTLFRYILVPIYK